MDLTWISGLLPHFKAPKFPIEFAEKLLFSFLKMQRNTLLNSSLSTRHAKKRAKKIAEFGPRRKSKQFTKSGQQKNLLQTTNNKSLRSTSWWDDSIELLNNKTTSLAADLKSYYLHCTCSNSMSSTNSYFDFMSILHLPSNPKPHSNDKDTAIQTPSTELECKSSPNEGWNRTVLYLEELGKNSSIKLKNLQTQHLSQNKEPICVNLSLWDKEFRLIPSITMPRWMEFPNYR